MIVRMLSILQGEGVFRSAIILPAPMRDSGWVLAFEKNGGGREIVTLTSSNIEKVYKSVDKAVSDARKIGFSEITVLLNKKGSN